MEPFTRVEMFLAKAAGKDVTTPKPITRVEKFLQNLIDHIASIGNGNGSTGSVPSIATASVGQTIVVKAVDENGKPTEWEAVDLPSGSGGKSLVVELKPIEDSDDETKYSVENFQELYEVVQYIDNKTPITGYLTSYRGEQVHLGLVSANNSYVFFSYARYDVGSGENSLEYVKINMTAEGHVATVVTSIS